MKNKSSQVQRGISALMIFVLLIYTSGCAGSRRVISVSEIPQDGKYYYIIHNMESKYLLDDPVIDNEVLSGKIDNVSSVAGKKIHIYVKSDSVVNIDQGMVLQVPLDGIAKIEITETSTGKTILFVLGCTFGLLIIVGLLSGSYGFSGFDFDGI